jgi:glycerol-3-phosphate dehydrogenase (NAD(P)+)
VSRIAILGAGAWGTALAISLARRGGHELCLWAHSPDHARQLSETGENTRYLPGYILPADVHITSSLDEAITAAETILCVTPSQSLRSIVGHIAPLLTPSQVLLSASKGIEEKTFLRMSQVIAQVMAEHAAERADLNNPIAVIGGPSFAQEVAAALPTALSVACEDPIVATRLQNDFSSPSLRVYRNEDLAGTELGGALKNVIALAAGVVAGLDLGHNASAALITRGNAEITRLAIACGGRRETMAGLSGIGDLVLTCSSNISRNRTVGFELGRGRQLPEILASLNGKVAEGVLSTTAALGLAARYGVEMPITEQMAAILHHGKSPRDAIRELMTRPGRTE